MIKIRNTKMPSNAKCLFFCIFNILKLKMYGLKSNLIYKPIMYKRKITQVGYQAAKHPTQCIRTIKMKR
jgi:hypothetical protein